MLLVLIFSSLNRNALVFLRPELSLLSLQLKRVPCVYRLSSNTRNARIAHGW